MTSTWLHRQAKKLFLNNFQNLKGGFLEIVCPEESFAFGNPQSALRAMAVIHDERFFLRAVTGADIGIGESYMDGDWTSPDLVALVRVVVRNLRSIDSGHPLAAFVRKGFARVQHRMRANTVRGSKENIHAHYDIGNEFYSLFLDAGMNYSSAYFEHPEDSLETAQSQKLERICRKLDIQRGDRVLEIGCGWGGFALHAARHHGAHVTAVTISNEQFQYVQSAIPAAKLAQGKVEVVLEDYRNLQGKFDKIVSIEMFEAVGLSNYGSFFSACDRLLDRDGTMLLQTISLQDQELKAYRKRIDWIQRYIFPGSELASLSEIHRSISHGTSLSVVSMDNMGMHYTRTLEHWHNRFDQNQAGIKRLGFDDRFLRMWDFYFSWCEGAFAERYISVVQLLFAKNGMQKRLLGDPAEAGPVLARAAGA